VVALVVVAGVAAADRRPTAVDVMPFVAGTLPGSPAITIKVRPSAGFCGGTSVSAVIKKSRKVAAPDPQLAAVFALAFPKGLDFDPDHEARRKASLVKFDKWFSAVQKTAVAARTVYAKQLADAALEPVDRVIAAARLVQVVRWAGQVIARAPVPSNVTRFPEVVDVYCQALAEKADQFEALAIDVATTCRTLSTTVNPGAGWWDDVCAP